MVDLSTKCAIKRGRDAFERPIPRSTDELPCTHTLEYNASSMPEGWVNIVGGCCGTTPETHQRNGSGRPQLGRRSLQRDFFYREAAK